MDMVVSESGVDAAARYVANYCVAGSDLAAAAGLRADALAILRQAGVVPDPTYKVSPYGVSSAIGNVGDTARGDATGHFGPAVAPWLARASLLLASVDALALHEALINWLATDLAAALRARAAEARLFGWGHLFDEDRCDLERVREEVASYWGGWMNGGWAVCLRRFDGHHLATKEIERRRIASLTQEGCAQSLSLDDRLALFDAIARLESVLLPFAPHERPRGTPGVYIDAPSERYGLPRRLDGAAARGAVFRLQMAADPAETRTESTGTLTNRT